MLKISRIVAVSIFLFFQLLLVAQNNTNSPYTRFGYGELAGRSYGSGRAMGGIGYGLRSSKQINPLNPASYSSMDSMTFLFDMGVSAQLSWFDDGTNKQQDVNGNIEYIALQFPVYKRIAMSVGLLPYSYVGYDFGAVQQINEETSGRYVEQFVGTGGLNDLYAGLSFEVWKKRLSIGANVGYLFGNIVHQRNTSFVDSEDANSVNSWQKIRISDMKFDFGLQYTQPLTSRENITVGLVYSPKNTLSNKMYKITQEYKGTSIIESSGDTTKNTPMGLPDSYGIGLTYVKQNKLTVGADFLYESWKNIAFPFVDNNIRFENRVRVAAGGEYTPHYMGRNFFSRINYRAGAHYSNSYLEIEGAGYKEYGVSVGFGLPLVDRRSLLNLSFEYVKIKPQVRTMIDEQYLRFTINYTFNEHWFFRKKLN